MVKNVCASAFPLQRTGENLDLWKIYSEQFPTTCPYANYTLRFASEILICLVTSYPLKYSWSTLLYLKQHVSGSLHASTQTKNIPPIIYKILILLYNRFGGCCCETLNSGINRRTMNPVKNINIQCLGSRNS